jgi:hypothetical protein
MCLAKPAITAFTRSLLAQAPGAESSQQTEQRSQGADETAEEARPDHIQA